MTSLITQGLRCEEMRAYASPSLLSCLVYEYLGSWKVLMIHSTIVTLNKIISLFLPRDSGKFLFLPLSLD